MRLIVQFFLVDSVLHSLLCLAYWLDLCMSVSHIISHITNLTHKQNTRSGVFTFLVYLFLKLLNLKDYFFTLYCTVKWQAFNGYMTSNRSGWNWTAEIVFIWHALWFVFGHCWARTLWWFPACRVWDIIWNRDQCGKIIIKIIHQCIFFLFNIGWGRAGGLCLTIPVPTLICDWPVALRPKPSVHTAAACSQVWSGCDENWHQVWGHGTLL